MSKRFDKWLTKEMEKIARKYKKSHEVKGDYYLTLCVMSDKNEEYLMANNRHYAEDRKQPVNIFIRKELQK